MENIKAIVIKCTLEGMGVAQSDQGDQKYALRKSSNYPVHSRHDNVIYSKKVFSEDPKDKGKLLSTVKISSDCVRHAIHFSEHPSHTPNVAFHEMLKVAFVSHMGTHQRGYLITDTGEVRKSGYGVTDFVEVSGAVPVLEIHTRSGAKVSGNEESASDTSLFNRESLGSTRYEGRIVIDPETLRTVSLSDLQGRRALVESSVPLFREMLGKQLGSEVPAPAFFIDPLSAYQIPEKMIRLNDSQVRVLILDLLRKICKVHISKSQSGYARVSSVQIKGIVDPLNDYDDTGWVSLFKDGHMDEAVAGILLGSFENRFQEMSLEEASGVLFSFDESVSSAKAEALSKKKDAKDAKNNQKNSKKS